MYEAHFGLREMPFGLTPDTGYFLACDRHQAALNTLLVAARAGEGFVKITGEVGTGKTMLCRKFLAILGDDDFYAAYLPNPMMTPEVMLRALAVELGVDPRQASDWLDLVANIQRRLIALTLEGKRVLVCLDEAQALPVNTLEALRLLTNLETEKRKLLQIVLFGQPELDRELARPELRQLAQRITFQCRLEPLAPGDLAAYLAHRLAVAGCNRSQIFSAGAVRALQAASGGTPRLVNILAHKSLMLVYGEGGQVVLARHARVAADDTLGVRRSGWSRWLPWVRPRGLGT